MVRFMQLVVEEKNKVPTANGSTENNNESTQNASNLNSSNGNSNHSSNQVSSTYSQQTMENGTKDTLRVNSLFENQVSDEEYSANHVETNHVNGHDPESANVVVIRASELQKTREPVAGPSGLQKLGTGSKSQEMQVDLNQSVDHQTNSRSSVLSSKRGSSLYDDKEYEDSSNDELRKNRLAKKKSEPQKKRKRLVENSNTGKYIGSFTNVKRPFSFESSCCYFLFLDQNQMVVVSPVTRAADPNKTLNTDSSIHLGDKIHSEQCILCSCKQKNISKHYSEVHPDAENYISRPPPSLADRMRRETSNLNRSATGDWIGICGFCKKKLLSKRGWQNHIRMHTGEKLYSCDCCNLEFDAKKEHSKCKNPIVKNIYEKFSNDAIKGFICDECNFIQINEDRMKKHLRNEHKATSIGVKYQQIDLILDETQPNEIYQTNWKFVEERLRFKCGLENCDFHSDEIHALQAHLTSKHRKCVKTTCVHCKQSIQLQENQSMVEKYVNHLNLHGNDVYECSLCETSYHELDKIVKHLINSHRSNELNAGHFHRKVENTAIETVATDIGIKFQCVVCEIQLNNLDNILNHFEALHFGYNIDTSVLILERSRFQSEQHLTFDSSRWRLRQTIACDSCKTEPQSMKELAVHCQNIHNSQNMDLKLTQLKLINVNDCPSEQREFMFDRIFFACHYCINGIRPHELFADIESVQKHWSNVHANDEIGKPFRFQVSEMAACNYCDSIGPYHSLKHHHAAKHGKSSFCISSIANKNKCALCQFVQNSDTELIDHFKSQHDEYHRLDVFSPLCLAEPILNKLLELNCQGIVDASISQQHHSVIHSGKGLNCICAANNLNYQILCSFCRDSFGRNLAESIDHLLNFHKYEYKCGVCPEIRSNDMLSLVDHDIKHHSERIETAFKKRQRSIRTTILKANFKSLAIFENGLTLSTNCLGGTRLNGITKLTTEFDSKMMDIRKTFEESQPKRKSNG